MPNYMHVYHTTCTVLPRRTEVESIVMASSLSRQATLTGTKQGKQKRKSYTREFKLSVVQYLRQNNHNVSQTARHFSIDRKMVQRWVKDEEKIKASSKGSKKSKHERRADYPEMEEELHREYRQLRTRGLKVKGWWFRKRGNRFLRTCTQTRPLRSRTVGLLLSNKDLESAIEGQPTHAKRSQAIKKVPFSPFIWQFGMQHMLHKTLQVLWESTVWTGLLMQPKTS